VTPIPPDMSPTSEELRAEVHRLVNQVVTIARVEHGYVPSVRSQAWWTAPLCARIAAVLALGEAYLMADPARAADEQLKAMSVALSQARSWSDAARLPSPPS
jgi:hypothetical protein